MANVSKRIPSNTQPTWQADINGKRYEYQSGITADVPEEVAALIDDAEAGMAKEDPRASQRGIEKDVTQIVKDNFAGGVGYEETSEFVMLPETSFEHTGEDQGTIIKESFPYAFEIGKKYTVTFDGVTNTYTAFDQNKMGVLTNTSLAEVTAGRGWGILVLGGQVQFVTLDPSLFGVHTISISRSVNTVHRIDNKFMKEDMPLYVLESSSELAASENGTALEPNELAELLKTKHCYIIETEGSESYMEILSYMVKYQNNVAVYVKCCYILPSSQTILFTKNGTSPTG